MNKHFALGQLGPNELNININIITCHDLLLLNYCSQLPAGGQLMFTIAGLAAAILKAP